MADDYCNKLDPESGSWECEEWKRHTGPHKALIGWPTHAASVYLHWHRGQVWLTRGGEEIKDSRKRVPTAHSDSLASDAGAHTDAQIKPETGAP